MKKLVLKPGKEKLIASRHPWIFSGALKGIDKTISPGDEVMLCDHAGQPLGLGHFCGSSGLSVRMLSFDPNDRLDSDFYNLRFLQAWNLRKALGLPNLQTNAFRLIHGEGDGLSGLVCDIYDQYAYIELSNPGLKQACTLLADFLRSQLKITKVLMNGDEAIGEVLFLENGLRFVTNGAAGQKTGHFLDQRENRKLVYDFAKGKTVLDAFSYSGGFSLYALMAGAKSVTSLDISDKALALVNANVQRNGPFVGQHKTWCEDAFGALRTMEKNHYDLVVLDPPAFAKSAQAVNRAARGYKDINLLALKNIKSGGFLFTFSCSQHIDADLFQKIIFAAAKDAGREALIVHQLGQGPDHPVSVYCPQSSYLKGLALYIR